LPRVFFCFVFVKTGARPRKAPFLFFGPAKENENLKKQKTLGSKKNCARKKEPKRGQKKELKTGKEKKEKNDAQQQRQPYHFIPLLM
jgi:hypothetical protein